MFEEGPVRRILREKGFLKGDLLSKRSPNGGYEPYIVLYKVTETSPWVVSEFSNSEEAYDEYEKLRYTVDTVILAQRLRKSVRE